MRWSIRCLIALRSRSQGFAPRQRNPIGSNPIGANPLGFNRTEAMALMARRRGATTAPLWPGPQYADGGSDQYGYGPGHSCAPPAATKSGIQLDSLSFRQLFAISR